MPPAQESGPWPCTSKKARASVPTLQAAEFCQQPVNLEEDPEPQRDAVRLTPWLPPCDTLRVSPGGSLQTPASRLLPVETLTSSADVVQPGGGYVSHG